MAQYALQPSRHSQLGPYDVHEILHHYQMTSNELAGMTAVHTLFETSMLEAEREVGLPRWTTPHANVEQAGGRVEAAATQGDPD